MATVENYPLEGIKIGQYDVLEGIGRGGFARVYRGKDADGGDCAIKVGNPTSDLSPNNDEREMFQAEVAVLSRLNHPNIIPVLDSGTYCDPTAIAHGKPVSIYYDYFVMPLAEGSLESEINGDRKTLPPEQGIKVVDDIANALDHSHRQGVLHRDVKPANILLFGGRYVVADFGTVIKAHDLDSYNITKQRPIGTLLYCSPEQLIGNARTPSDTYSLGMLASRMCVGSLPYYVRGGVLLGGAYRSALLDARRRSFAELARESGIVMTDVLAEMEPVIFRAVERMPELRQSSPGAFADDLTEAYHRGTAKQNRDTTVVPLAVAQTRPYTESDRNPPIKFRPGFAAVDGALNPDPGLTSVVKPKPAPKINTPAVEQNDRPQNKDPRRMRRITKWLAAAALVATVSGLGVISATYGLERAKNATVDFLSDDRTKLTEKIMTTDTNNRADFIAALRAFVKEEVQQNSWRLDTYDTRPIRIMAGDSSVLDGYVKDVKAKSGNVNRNTQLDDIYNPRLLAAYRGIIIKDERGMPVTQLGVASQIDFWLGDKTSAQAMLDQFKLQANDTAKAALDSGYCGDYTLDQVLLTRDKKLAEAGIDACDNATSVPGDVQYQLVGRLAAASGDFKGLQKILTQIFRLRCSNSSQGDPANYMIHDESDGFTTKPVCTDHMKFATAADLAAYTLLFDGKNSNKAAN